MARFLGDPAPVALKKLRDRAGLSMDELAKRAGYKHASGLQRYENVDQYKKRYLSLDVVRKLAPALVGLGDPKITADDVYGALAGIAAPDLIYQSSVEEPLLVFEGQETQFLEQLSRRLIGKYPELAEVPAAHDIIRDRGLELLGTAKSRLAARGSNIEPKKYVLDFAEKELSDVFEILRRVTAKHEEAGVREKVRRSNLRSLGDRLAEARRAQRLTVPELARRTGLDPVELADWENNDGIPSREVVERLEEALSASLATQGSSRAFAEYLPLADQPVEEPSNVRMAERAPDIAHWTWPRDIPVMGTSQCGDDGAFEINNGDPIRNVPRPPSLAGIRGVYAIYAEGESMIPAHRPGRLVYVHPRLPLVIGEDVVIQVRPEYDGDNPRSYLKTLVSKGIGGYRVKQWNPVKEIFFPIETVLSVHRVLTLEELLNA